MAKFGKGHEKLGGRVKGSKNKSTILFENLLNDNKYELLATAIKMAKEGNATIMNKLLDKFMPSLNSIDFNKDKDVFPPIEIHVRSNERPT